MSYSKVHKIYDVAMYVIFIPFKTISIVCPSYKKKLKNIN